MIDIVRSILFQCRVHAEQPAICAPGTTFDLVTYGQLEYMLNNTTRAVLSLNLSPGQIVGIWVKDKIFHVVLMLSLMRLGVVTVSCRGPWLPDELGAAAIITDTAEMSKGAEKVVRANLDWVRGSKDQVVEGQLFAGTGDELCRIILTSGSTGTPKAIAFSQNKLVAKNARLEYCQGPRWPVSSRLFCDLGLSSSQGFRYVINMLMRGGMVMVYGEDGMTTLQSLNLFAIQNMATSPHGLSEYLRFFESAPSFHSNFDHVLIAGGMLTKALAERAWARLSPNIISLYGATEVGAIATADARLSTEVPGAVGYVLPDAEAQIVDESHEKVKVGTEGTVRVRTGQGITGYYGDPKTSAQFFRDGWFYPGDYGYITEEGLLVITGRQETRLNIGGEKINPETIEAVLATFPGISDVAVLAVPNAVGLEEVHALIKAERRPADEDVKTHCRTRLQQIFIPVRYIVVDRIPRNEIGKIERGQLADLAKGKQA